MILIREHRFLKITNFECTYWVHNAFYFGVQTLLTVLIKVSLHYSVQFVIIAKFKIIDVRFSLNRFLIYSVAVKDVGLEQIQIPINFKLVAGSRKCSWNVMVDCIRRGHSFFKTSTCLQFRSVSDISNYSSSSTWHIVVFFNTYELMQTQNMHLCSCLCFPLKWPLWRNMFLVCSK